MKNTRVIMQARTTWGKMNKKKQKIMKKKLRIMHRNRQKVKYATEYETRQAMYV